MTDKEGVKTQSLNIYFDAGMLFLFENGERTN